ERPRRDSYHAQSPSPITQRPLPFGTNPTPTSFSLQRTLWPARASSYRKCPDRTSKRMEKNVMTTRKLIQVATLMAVLLSTMLGAGSARADGVIVVDPPWCDPFCPEPTFVGDQLVVKNHLVDVVIDNQIAT